jgi:microcystin-dependent protein
MNRDGIPLPSALSGNIIERLVRIDEALFYLIIGAMAELTDDWWLEQTGTLTPEDAKVALMEMLWCLQEACDVTPIGAIFEWPTATIPDRWLLCDGQSLLRATYPALFAILGTSYGAVDGTHFNVPDMRGRSPMMPGAGVVNALAQQAGADAVALAITNMPAHDHDFADTGHQHDQQIGASSAYLGTGGTGRVAYSAVTTNSLTRVRTDTGGGGITFHSQGSGTPHANLHPVLGLNFIIYSGVE